MRRAILCAGLLAIAVAIRLVRAQTPSPPTFRAGVDVIQLNVSVLDGKRQPVRDLTADDFTVFENGTRQHVIGAIEMTRTRLDPPPSAWMRSIVPDVAINNLGDAPSTGRLVAILVDDRNLPWDEMANAVGVRGTVRRLIADLGPSDSAALVYAEDAGNSQDFTTDRSKLLAAVDAYNPHPFVVARPATGPSAPDMRSADPSLAEDPCLPLQPAIPALHALVARMAAVREPRRKTIIYVGEGVAMEFSTRAYCEATYFSVMRDTFSAAAHGDVTIHTIDPIGPVDLDAGPMPVRGGRGRAMGSPFNPGGPQRQHDFLEIVTDNTGGRAIVNVDDMAVDIDRIFQEDASYYLVGYETSNPQADGRFRKVQVHVNRPGVTVHAMSGYWGTPGGAARLENDRTPTPQEYALSALGGPVGLPLRAEVIPAAVHRLADGQLSVEVAAVLTARVPSERRAVQETLRTTRTVYDVDGRSGWPATNTSTVALDPGTSDEQRYDVLTSWPLAPGRYQIRFNAHSAVADADGSVYADVVVPDFVGDPLSMTPIVLGGAAASAQDALAAILPIVPTTDREFASGDHVKAFFRVFEGVAMPPSAASIGIQILDASDAVKFEETRHIDAGAIGAMHGVDELVDVPLAQLADGPYVLNVAVTAGDRHARQDLLFRLRPGAN